MARKREDAATVGDLEDLAEKVKGGFDAVAEALKGKGGKRAPAPDPVDDDGDGGDGDGDGDHVPSWTLSKAWFGEH